MILLIARGAFTQGRSAWAAGLLGLILVWDLGRADAPWIRHYDYQAKYANNGVLQVLADKPYEHRFSMPPLQVDRNFSLYQQIYNVEWLQHQFPYYNIQSLDQPQEPRPPADKQAYRVALDSNPVRLWELTNTRFLGGMAGNFTDMLNQQLDPVQKRFRLHTRFNFAQDAAGNIGARVDDNGPFALIEFTGALPRASLYTQWQVLTNNQEALTRLASPAFDPHQQVLVADSIAGPPAANTGLTNAGTVEFASYEPKRIQLKANATASSLLLLNDKFDTRWKVTVDGTPAPLLRCNFFMRGVELKPGQHTVEFRYQSASRPFLISLAATGVGLILCGILCFGRRMD